MTTRLLCLLLLLPVATFADDFPGRVVSESGGTPTDVRVTIDGKPVAVSAEGRFLVPAPDERAVRLRIEADDHYAFVHTVTKRDLELELFGDIVLVPKKAGRRLLLFAGDAMLTRRYFEPPDGEHTLVREASLPDDARRLLDAVRPYIGLADYASVNVETPLADDLSSEPLPKSVNFVSSPVLARTLADAGFDYAALGNNHSYDFRDEGVEKTLAALRETGLDASGAGVDEATARAPLATDIFGQSYAFLSYVGWAGNFSPSQAADGDKGGAALGNVQVFSEDLEHVSPLSTAVLQHHSGLEYVEQPPMTVATELYHAVDAGADLVVAHHPHVLQGLELYRNKLIAWSMGNFLFDQTYPTTQLGMLLYVWMDGSQFHRAEIVPLHISDYRPVPATGNHRYAALHRLSRLSQVRGTCFSASGAHIVLTGDAACAATAMTVPAGQSGVISLRKLGLSPLVPYYPINLPGRHRLGTDILRSGEFDYEGRFGTRDRAWIRGRGDTVDGSYKVRVLPGDGGARIGMKGFQRVYTPSTPTTLSGRVRAQGAVSVRFSLQRRTTRASMAEALESGPTKTVGELTSVSSGWMPFAFQFDQPRVGTREVRLLIDIENADGDGAVVEFDDLSWVEWRTPWLTGSDASQAEFATHIEAR